MARSRRPGRDLFANVTLHARNGESRGVRMVVDPRTMFTSIPSKMARDLGVTPRMRVRFQRAEGRVTWRRLGELEVEVEGRRATAIVVFGTRRDAVVLGAHALLELMLQVDPHGERLIRKEYALFIRAAA